MFNPFKKADQLFEIFISDEDARIVCHIFFWPLAYLISWALLINLGPFLIFYFILFMAPIFIFTKICFKKNTFIVVPVGLLLLGLVAGVPWVYSGLLVKFLKTKMFVGLFQNLIFYWWKGFNHLWPFKDWVSEDGQYDLNFFTVQAIYWASGVILPMVFLTWFNYQEEQRPVWEKEDFNYHEAPLTPEEAKAQDAWRIEHDKIMEERRLKDEAKKLEEKKLQEKALEERRQAEARAVQEAERRKKEEEDKRLKKIQEVRGKNPWDSGFL